MGGVFVHVWEGGAVRALSADFYHSSVLSSGTVGLCFFGRRLDLTVAAGGFASVVLPALLFGKGKQSYGGPWLVVGKNIPVCLCSTAAAKQKKKKKVKKAVVKENPTAKARTRPGNVSACCPSCDGVCHYCAN